MGGEKYPQIHKKYFWNHWTDLDHVNTIRHEISSSFILFKKMFEKHLFFLFRPYVYFFNTKDTVLIKKSNFRLRKTCVLYQPCDIFIGLKATNSIMFSLNTFSNERKGKIQDDGLNRKWIRQKRLSPLPHLIATRFPDSNSYTYVFGVGHTNGTCIYTV